MIHDEPPARHAAENRADVARRNGSGFTVLIPTHRDAHLLRRSLPVLLMQRRLVEVIVLNNDPAQDVAAEIGSLAHDDRVTIVEMGYEAGFSRAINRGIRESGCDLIMFCNADLFPSPSYVSEIVAFFERHPAAGAAIGKILRYDLEADRPTNRIDTAGLLLSRQRRFMPRGEGEIDTGQFDEECEVFGVDGAASVVRRAALEDIAFDGEYLDERFVVHKEDHDVSWRLRLAGWECWYVPSALAHHARTTRGLGAKGYLGASRSFFRNERQKSRHVQIHAMKNQWLMLLRNEDGFNFRRDFPFIFAREAMIFCHHAVFAPSVLVAVPMTLKLFPETLRRRRSLKHAQVMDARELRGWLARPGAAARSPAAGSSLLSTTAKRAERA